MGDSIFGDKEHQEVAREALPILIEKAKAGETINYGTLAHQLGISAHEYPMPQMLGSIVTTLSELGEEWNEDLPRLTALVVRASNGYPSFPPGTPNEVFDAEFERIYNYPKWDAVQHTLLPDASDTEPEDETTILEKSVRRWKYIALTFALAFLISLGSVFLVWQKSPPEPSRPPFVSEMAMIPAGEFQRGSDDTEAGDDEQPVRMIYLDTFYIDRYEVTNAQYKQFVDANPLWQKDRIPSEYHDGDYLKHWEGNNYPESKENHPVVYISWYAAMAYAEWAGKRLPTEAEWEKAARGGLGEKAYPWGNSIDPSKANYSAEIEDTTSVGNYPANAYGLYDMSGNAWEWCLDLYETDFYDRSPLRNPVAGESLAEITETFRGVHSPRVLRGGYWNNPPVFVRVADRYKQYPGSTHRGSGFRCVIGSL